MYQKAPNLIEKRACAIKGGKNQFFGLSKCHPLSRGLHQLVGHQQFEFGLFTQQAGTQENIIGCDKCSAQPVKDVLAVEEAKRLEWGLVV